MSGTTPKLARKWEVLSADQVRRLHDTTMDLLERVGVVFQNDEVLNLLRKRGARLDGQRARLPASLVERAIESSPGRVILHGRHRSRDVVLGEGNIHFTSCYGPVRVRRLGESATVPGTLEDLRRLTLLSDALDNVSYCLFQVRPSEVPAGWHEVYSAATMLKLTDKHIHFSQDTAAHTELLINLGEIAAADGPQAAGAIFSLGCCPTSPLIYTDDSLRRLLVAVPKGIPFLIVSGAMSGATAPASLAGTLVTQNAEVLAGVALAQLIRPGAPVIYGSFSSGLDMHSGAFVMGGPELALMQAATAQLCALYSLPFGYGSGGWTDASQPNLQTGLEKGCTLLASALSGVEVIHSAHGGMLGGAQIADYAQVMIDEEICAMVNRYLRGIEVTSEALAFEAIEQAGPGGHFLDTEHTARLFRGEHFLPSLLRRGESQESAGLEELLERAAGRARAILDSHQPRCLSPDASKAIDELVDKAREKQGG